jgi:hypothetical protein
MTDQPRADTSASVPSDPIPLLPGGAVVFEAIPVQAIVMEALAPAIGDGTLLIRGRDRHAVVLVRDGAILETHAFAGGKSRSGKAMLDEVQSWDDAGVWAQRLEAPLVDLSSALLRGETLYDDLRLDWTSWRDLLADLGRRGGAFVVEVFSPSGRGVTCVAAGLQALSYTDIHPSLGDPALLEAMASNREGSIRVRHVRSDAFAGLTQVTRPAAQRPARRVEPTPAPQPAADLPDSEAPATNGSGSGHGRPEPEHEWSPAAWQRPEPSAAAADAPGVAPRDARPEPEDEMTDLLWVAPWQSAWREEAEEELDDEPAVPARRPQAEPEAPRLSDVLADLQAIARRRLQMSASRVVLVLDDAAMQHRPIDTVLAEIREMSIRGVMPATVEAMVDEMEGTAALHRV